MAANLRALILTRRSCSAGDKEAQAEKIKRKVRRGGRNRDFLVDIIELVRKKVKCKILCVRPRSSGPGSTRCSSLQVWIHGKRTRVEKCMVFVECSISDTLTKMSSCFMERYY
ncbi:hypothetical protein ES703_51388 [subsurface metagenome]